MKHTIDEVIQRLEGMLTDAKTVSSMQKMDQTSNNISLSNSIIENIQAAALSIAKDI
jgi:hypothetical protein